MSEGKTVTVWSGQKQVVMDALRESGRYVSKTEYVDKKYQDTAWIFRQAYQFLAGKAREIVPMPDGAEYPVWVYGQRHHIFPDFDTYYLKLDVPQPEILLFDSRKWNKILNLEYLGKDRQDEIHFADWLEQRGIYNKLNIFRTPHYPVEKKEIIKSWDRLLEDKETEPSYVQGMVWEIKNEWIKELYKHGGAG